MNTTEKVRKSVRDKTVRTAKPPLSGISQASTDDSTVAKGKDTVIDKITDVIIEFLWKFFSPLLFFVLNWCQSNPIETLLTVVIVLFIGILMVLLYIAISWASKR